MAVPQKPGAKPAKGAVNIKRRKTSKRYKDYTVSGGKLERKTKFCPKCGPGVMMGLHKDRMTCGKCKYTEFGKK